MGGPKILLKVDCLPNAVGKQPSIPLINSWKKMDVKLMMMMMSDDETIKILGTWYFFVGVQGRHKAWNSGSAASIASHTREGSATSIASHTHEGDIYIWLFIFMLRFWSMHSEVGMSSSRYTISSVELKLTFLLFYKAAQIPESSVPSWRRQRPVLAECDVRRRTIDESPDYRCPGWPRTREPAETFEGIPKPF